MLRKNVMIYVGKKPIKSWSVPQEIHIKYSVGIIDYYKYKSPNNLRLQFQTIGK